MSTTDSGYTLPRDARAAVTLAQTRDTDVSVCMATYNGMPYVEAQVASILIQLAPGDELVISDNGSSDGTAEYLRALGDPRVRVVTFLARRGPVPNFENVFRLASRPIVVPVDQDDLWLPNRLAAIRAAFARGRRDLLCVMTEGDRIDGAGARIEASNIAVLGFRTGFWKNLWKNSYMGCAMAFRRDLLDLALPIPPGVPMHDSWLGLLAERFGAVDVVREPSYRYRVHGRNASHVRNDLRTKLAHRVRLLRALVSRIVAVRARRAWDRLAGERQVVR